MNKIKKWFNRLFSLILSSWSAEVCVCAIIAFILRVKENSNKLV